jgi:hypothetical protein
MIASRTAARAATRTVRAPIRRNARQIRFVSTEQKTAAQAGGSSGLVAGIAGGAIVFAVSPFSPLKIHLPTTHYINTNLRPGTDTTTSPARKPSSTQPQPQKTNSTN